MLLASLRCKIQGQLRFDRGPVEGLGLLRRLTRSFAVGARGSPVARIAAVYPVADPENGDHLALVILHKCWLALFCDDSWLLVPTFARRSGALAFALTLPSFVAILLVATGSGEELESLISPLRAL